LDEEGAVLWVVVVIVVVVVVVVGVVVGVMVVVGGFCSVTESTSSFARRVG
jgi:hypothetical protein